MLCCAVAVPSISRTVPQAQQLSRVTDIQLALNLSLRHEVLVEKCCGRRICSHCGKNFNIADIYLPADGNRWVVMWRGVECSCGGAGGWGWWMVLEDPV
jgi:adenylate kinase family enzyme